MDGCLRLSRKLPYIVSQSKKLDYATPLEIDQPIDPNEPTYSFCRQCQGGEWFHYSCDGLTPETRFKGKWYCPTCRQIPLFGCSHASSEVFEFRLSESKKTLSMSKSPKDIFPVKELGYLFEGDNKIPIGDFDVTGTSYSQIGVFVWMDRFDPIQTSESELISIQIIQTKLRSDPNQSNYNLVGSVFAIRNLINQNQSKIQINSSVFVQTNPNIQISEPYSPIQIIQLDNSREAGKNREKKQPNRGPNKGEHKGSQAKPNNHKSPTKPTKTKAYHQERGGKQQQNQQPHTRGKMDQKQKEASSKHDKKSNTIRSSK
ncbi:hypothetical protein LXL04_004352 [Taraxacum kok-saghyz]